MGVIASDTIEIIQPMTRDDARRLTSEIRGHLSDARTKILQMYRDKGYLLMDYNSFKDWAIGEFEISWQQVYNLKTAAEIDETILPLVSPRGELYNIPVNHARELRKLKSEENQVRALQLAHRQADAQGKDKPTETIIRNAVESVQAEEYVDTVPYPVVKQMVADEGITAREGRKIALELDKLNDQPAQAYVQKLMARYDLKNPKLIFPIGFKHKSERQKGNVSYVLDEIDRTKCLSGTPLAEATEEDLKRANEEAKQKHIADAEEAKRQKQLELHKLDPEKNPLPPEQVAITVWKRSPARTLKNLERDLSTEDLDELFYLMAERRGFVRTEAQLTGDPFVKKPIPETGPLLAVDVFKRNGLDCNQADILEMIIRVKVEK